MKKYMSRIRESIQRFMYGRYGIDQLNAALLYCMLIFSIVGMVIQNTVICATSYIWMFLLFFRALSRDHSKRYRENQKFLELSMPVRKRISRFKRSMSDKTHKYYNCPSCRQTIRVPKGKGKIEIRCPKCSKEFIKRT